MQISTKEEELKMKGTFKQKSHLKFQKVKKKNSKKIKKKRKTDDASSSKFSNVSSQTHSQIWQDPVVEIYKNSALNAESESGLELVCNKKRIIAKEILLDMKNLSPFKNHETTEEKASGEPKPTRTNSHNSKKWGAFKEEAIQTEICLEGLLPIQARENEGKDFSNKENVGKTESLFESSKSYCQPTISSKRKQVDRDLYSNISGINVRSIPFIAAKSTTPSHNIGVNIQQVLSIIKKRHVGNENSIISLDSNSNENRLMALLGPKKLAYNEMEPISEPSTAVTCSSESKKKSEGVRTNLSHWRSSSDFNKDKQAMMKEKGLSENQSLDWSLKVDRLKKVLVFLHEDFTSLSQ